MTELLIPLSFVAFLWWFSTGAILYLDSLKKKTFLWSVSIMSLAAISSLFIIYKTAQEPSSANAYIAFVAAIVVWGWIELTFLTGVITGPVKRVWMQQPSTGNKRYARFLQAIGTVAHHEIAIAVLASILLALTYSASNQIALMTFLALWIMRTSAKLNLFLGVRNWSAEFLPQHLQYLTSYFKHRTMNWLFPGSVLISVWLIYHAMSMAFSPLAGDVNKTGMLLIAGLLALGLLEHVFMVLPFSAARLWKWAMPSLKENHE
jgi:putative photosynthetic complex assembly protein 2